MRCAVGESLCLAAEPILPNLFLCVPPITLHSQELAVWLSQKTFMKLGYEGGW